MSQHQETHDGAQTVTLPPNLRTWIDGQRSWHRQGVRVQAETRWIADGTPASVAVFLVGADGQKGRELQRGDAQIVGGRLLGPDGRRGFEHPLDWELGEAELGGLGLRAEVEIAAYAVDAASQTLHLDLQPFTISG